MRSIASRASRAAPGMYSASCPSVSSALGSHMSPRGRRPTSPGAAVSDALLDPVARGRVEDPVVFDGLGHDLTVSPGHAGFRPAIRVPALPPMSVPLRLVREAAPG